MSTRNHIKLKTLEFRSDSPQKDYKKSISFKKEHFDSFETKNSVELLLPQPTTEEAITPKFTTTFGFSKTIPETDPPLAEENCNLGAILKSTYNSNCKSTRHFPSTSPSIQSYFCLTNENEGINNCTCKIY